MAAITTSFQSIPSKRELRLHAQTMEDEMAQIAEVNRGSTKATQRYKFSESSPHDFCRSLAVAGPLEAQPGYVHPQ
jgi:hypothetical protein